MHIFDFTLGSSATAQIHIFLNDMVQDGEGLHHRSAAGGGVSNTIGRVTHILDIRRAGLNSAWNSYNLTGKSWSLLCTKQKVQPFNNHFFVYLWSALSSVSSFFQPSISIVSLSLNFLRFKSSESSVSLLFV